MKKRLILLLATLMCISLCACGGSESTSGNNETNGKNETNGSGFTPTVTTDTEKDTEIVIDESNLEQYYDTTQFLGTPSLEQVQILWYPDKETVDVISSRMGEKQLFCVIQKPNTLTGQGAINTNAIFVDNNTPDDKSDDVIAYIFMK